MLKTRKNQDQNPITNYMYLGLLPFFIFSLGPWVFAEYDIALTKLFVFYSGLIFVFLTGKLWGIALFSEIENPTRHIHIAILFSLWPLALYFLSMMLSVMILLLGFLLFLFWEKCFINILYPEWYQKLRHQITFIVAGCHMMAIFNVLRM